MLGQPDDAHITRLVIISGTLQAATEAYNRQNGTYSTAPIAVIPKILGFGMTYGLITLSGYTYAVTTKTLTQTANPAPYVPQDDFPSQKIDD